MPARKTNNEAEIIAERLHSAAIRLLRRLRKSDTAMGLSAPKASALSALVFGGAMTLKDLAAAEQVRAPTMSRLITELEEDGLATKTVDKADRRTLRIAATAKGRKLLLAGRARRLSVLTAEIEALTADERAVLAAAAKVIAALNAASELRARCEARTKPRGVEAHMLDAALAAGRIDDMPGAVAGADDIRVGDVARAPLCREVAAGTESRTVPRDGEAQGVAVAARRVVDQDDLAGIVRERIDRGARVGKIGRPRRRPSVGGGIEGRGPDRLVRGIAQIRADLAVPEDEARLDEARRAEKRGVAQVNGAGSPCARSAATR